MWLSTDEKKKLLKPGIKGKCLLTFLTFSVRKYILNHFHTNNILFFGFI